MDQIKESALYKQDVESVLRLDCDWNKLCNKTILIAGATGLIGTVITDMFVLLNARFNLNLRLILVSRHEKSSSYDFIRYIAHDVTKPFILDDKIDFIISAASNTHPLQYSKFPIETITTNVFGTYNLLELASKNRGCRFVMISSVEIYGDDKELRKDGFLEDDAGFIDCNTARACYNESKRLSETLCNAYAAEKNVDFVTARICRSYGPTLKKDDSKALSQFLRNAINNEDIVLKSEGNQFYSYIYSADAASAVIYLMLKGDPGEAYNVSSPKSNIMLKNLAEIIANNCGTKVVFDIPSVTESKGFSKSQRAILNSSKINKLGWQAFFDIEQGLERTITMLKQDKENV